MDYRLLGSQRNQVFHVIRQRGMDPAEFDWKEAESRPYDYQDHEDEFHIYSVLEHKPTQATFTFRRDNRGCSVLFSPGLETPYFPNTEVSDFNGQLEYTVRWLECLKREIEAPDLWASVSQEHALVEAASAKGVSNNPFKMEEQQDISAKLDEIQQFLLAAHQFEESQKEFVRSRLDYLKNAAERMGRKDWLNLTTGTLLGIVVQTGLNSDAARELFRLAGSLLQSLFAGGMLPLLP